MSVNLHSIVALGAPRWFISPGPPVNRWKSPKSVFVIGPATSACVIAIMIGTPRVIRRNSTVSYDGPTPSSAEQMMQRSWLPTTGARATLNISLSHSVVLSTQPARSKPSLSVVASRAKGDGPICRRLFVIAVLNALSSFGELHTLFQPAAHVSRNPRPTRI